MHHHTSRVQKKNNRQHAHRPSFITITHQRSRSVETIKTSDLCAFFFSRSNAKDQIGKRIRQEDRQGSRCVAVSLGPVNLPTPSPSPPARPCLLLVSSSTEPYSVVCQVSLFHSPLYKPLGHQVSLLSWPSPLHLLSSFSHLSWLPMSGYILPASGGSYMS